jgi:hypothetical protein
MNLGAYTTMGGLVGLTLIVMLLVIAAEGVVSQTIDWLTVQYRRWKHDKKKAQHRHEK